mmetsp:Transcript_31301/g.93411  ORF Transcript_31301/g.93411 Transcript_31301/m.93411 type:complete len:231 (+) Transcript_31301:1355-2047(+)
MNCRPTASANDPTASIASSCTVAERSWKMRSSVCMIWSPNCSTAALVSSYLPSFWTMTCSTPHSWPCTSFCFSCVSAVLAGMSNFLCSSPSTTVMSCATISSVSRDADRTRSFIASNALIWTLANWFWWCCAHCNNALTTSLKNGDMTLVPLELDWNPAASAEMAQHTRYAMCGVSARPLVSTAMMGGRVSAVTIGGSMSGECINSKIRPMVHAVVSLTYGCGSAIADRR